MNGLRELGLLVRQHRSDAGLSGAELARRAGVPQPSVSRVETGRRLIDVAVLERLVVALGLGDEATRRLLTQARQEYAMPVARRVDAGVSLAAGRLVRLASGAQLMRSFSAAMVPALLRTADYAQAAGSDADQEALATWPAAS